MLLYMHEVAKKYSQNKDKTLSSEFVQSTCTALIDQLELLRCPFREPCIWEDVCTVSICSELCISCQFPLLGKATAWPQGNSVDIAFPFLPVP